MERLGLSERAAFAAAPGRRLSLAVRSEILVRCEHDPHDAPQLAEALGIDLPLASYHVAVLVRAGMLWVHERQLRPGAPLVRYRAAAGWAHAFGALNHVASLGA